MQLCLEIEEQRGDTVILPAAVYEATPFRAVAVSCVLRSALPESTRANTTTYSSRTHLLGIMAYLLSFRKSTACILTSHSIKLGKVGDFSFEGGEIIDVGFAPMDLLILRVHNDTYIDNTSYMILVNSIRSMDRIRNAGSFGTIKLNKAKYLHGPLLLLLQATCTRLCIHTYKVDT